RRHPPDPLSFPTRPSSDLLIKTAYNYQERGLRILVIKPATDTKSGDAVVARGGASRPVDILAHDGDDLRALTLQAQEGTGAFTRSEEHTSELQSRFDLVCR